MMGRHLIAAMAVLAALVFAAGCGSSDDDNSGDAGSNASAESNANGSGTTEKNGTASGPETGNVANYGALKSEFIDQANSLCANRTAQLAIKGKKVFKEVYSSGNKVAAERLADEAILPELEGELRDLKSIDVPREDARQVAAIYEAIEEVISQLKKDPTANEFYPYKKAEKLAAAYGLTSCGHP